MRIKQESPIFYSLIDLQHGLEDGGVNLVQQPVSCFKRSSLPIFGGFETLVLGGLVLYHIHLGITFIPFAFNLI